MKTVGELFASGEMQLPFVLGSAETMKTAVAYLEPYMEKADQGGKGTMVLATVKGDVHDIGKNLVDIILTNNGYTVRTSASRSASPTWSPPSRSTGADAIGMSGLLVKSTLIMRENLEELNRRGLAHIPVILGGAALTRTYVERDLRKVYDGRLFYGKDAFEGLRTMDRLVEMRKTGEDDPEFGTAIGGRDLGPARASCASRRPPRPAPGARRCRPARRTWPTDNPLFTAAVRRQPGGQGHGHRRHRRLPQRDGPVPQPVGLPARGGRGRRRLQGPGPGAACASSWPRPRPSSCWCPRWPGATSPPTPTATTWSSGPGRQPHRRADAVHLPPPDRGPVPVHQRLLPAGRLRRAGLRQLPGGHHGLAGLRGGGPAVRGGRVPALPVPARPRAWRWPRRWPSTGTAGSARSSASPTRTARP